MTNDQDKRAFNAPYPLRTVAVASLDLDLRNSRFARDAHDQGDALELMLTIAGDQCMDLLRDIARTGELNSADPPIVVEKDGRYVVVEGNRRTTALRLWSNPNVIADQTLAQRFKSRVERIAADSPFTAPAEVQVVVAPSEEAADRWIDLKHSNGSGGVGTVRWGAAMKDRRVARSDPSKATRALAFVELVSEDLGGDAGLQADLDTVREKRYTMIKRFVDRGNVRARVGLEFADGKMSFAFGADATAPIIRQVLSDFAKDKAASGKTWARELDTVEDFGAYLDDYQHLLPNTADSGTARPGSGTAGSPGGSGASTSGEGTSTGHGGDSPTSGQGPTSTAGDGTSDGSRPPRPTTAASNIFRGLVLDQFPRRLQEIVRQTSVLDVSTRNEVVAISLRVILDLTTHHFLISTGVTEPPRHLDKAIRLAIRQIDPQAATDLREAENTPLLRKIYQATEPNTIRLVQYALHDPHMSRTARETVVLADRYTPLLVAMNDWLRQNGAT